MLRAQNLCKVFRNAQGEVRALRGVSLEAPAGRFVVIRGPSGSGKSTLLLTLGGMLRPSGGRVTIADTDLYALGESPRARFRAAHIGFVFQMFHLVPYLNVLDNVLLSVVGGRKSRTAEARQMLARFGLADRLHHKPAELSAGEKQRAALVRALLKKPRLLLADEPTGNLDPDNAAEVFNGLDEYHRGGGTVIVVTHGTQADRYADQILHLGQGCLEAG